MRSHNELCVLITNGQLINRAGSELFVRDLAVELRKRGHKPVVYSPRLGPLAREIRAATVPVVDDLEQVGAAPDLIHGQHHLETMTALAHFPGVPAVYCCHGWLPWAETPPRHPRVLLYAAVSEAVRDRLVYEHGIPSDKVWMIWNWVDMDRFRPRSELPPSPRKALVFGNEASEATFVPMIREACSRHGISLDVVGAGNGNTCAVPERLLGHYDLVFARGRGAMESIAVGTAVICCGIEGAGPIVTTENFQELRKHNFGIRILDRPITVDWLSEQIAGYDPQEAKKVCELARAGLSLTGGVDEILKLYQAALHEPAVDPDPASEGKAVSSYLRWLSTSATEVSAERDRLQSELTAVRSTVTWKLYERVTHIRVLQKAYLLLAAPLKRTRAARAPRQERPEQPKCASDPEPEAKAKGPELACVVLSMGNPPSLPGAVRSLLAQSELVEIVVVNSAGGDAAGSLRSAGLDVRVVDHESRLYAGLARNVGIVCTRAPYVAFLACDCIAEPRWAEGRLNKHRAGWQAVSTAMTNPTPQNLWSWVAHLALYSGRMPGLRATDASHYGVSYARVLFDRFGFFREDLRTGEDSEFNSRLAGQVDIGWTPEVRSGHLHPTGLLDLLRDQWARGRRMVAAQSELTGKSQRLRVAVNSLTRVPKSSRLAWRASRGQERRWAMAAATMMPAAALSYSAGALLSRGRSHQHDNLRRPQIIALLVFHNEMTYLPGYFANVAHEVDGIIALDDGSTDGSGDFVSRQPCVLDLLRLPPRSPHVWDERRNQRLLVEAASRLKADWIVVVDADERLERQFRQRAIAQIVAAEGQGCLAYRVRLLELWNHDDLYRADGIWGNKQPARLFKARKDHEFDDRPLHGSWAPLNSRRDGDYPCADLIIYHLRMMRPEDRVARRERYESLDPCNQYQEMGYSYLTDEDGLTLKPLLPGREYEPLAQSVPQ